VRESQQWSRPRVGRSAIVRPWTEGLGGLYRDARRRVAGGETRLRKETDVSQTGLVEEGAAADTWREKSELACRSRTETAEAGYES
jgi:hypothetical protein